MNRRAKDIRLGFENLERRDTPSSLITNPGTIRGFNPQPEPPADIATAGQIPQIRVSLVGGGRTA